MRRSWIVSAAVAVAAVVAVAALTPIGAATEADLEGVWRSRGYGWIWDVKDGRVKTYDESGPLCLPSSRRRFDLDDPDVKLEISPDKKTIRILMDDDQFRLLRPHRCAPGVLHLNRGERILLLSSMRLSRRLPSLRLLRYAQHRLDSAVRAEGEDHRDH